MSPLIEARTLDAWKKAAGAMLSRHGGLPREAVWMAEEILGLCASELLAQRNLSSQERSELNAALKRRCQGEPLQYVLGSTEFRGLKLKTTPAALIPRPETEGLVERVLAHIPADATGWVADIGTGSGCIALGLVVERPGLRALATDVSPAAIVLAQENADALGLSTRVDFHRGDLLEPLQGREPFLAVISNPPYVAPEEKRILPPEVVDFEPPEALFSPGHGLSHIQTLTVQAPRHLLPGGLLALEIGETQGEAVRTLLEPGPWDSVRIEKDLAGKTRYALAEKQNG